METFSADLAVVTITGVNIHPALAKDRMVNAVRLAAAFVDRLPRQTLSPEASTDREGFLHPYTIEGGVGKLTLGLLLRDFETPKLEDEAGILRNIAKSLAAARTNGYCPLSRRSKPSVFVVTS